MKYNEFKAKQENKNTRYTKKGSSKRVGVTKPEGKNRGGQSLLNKYLSESDEWDRSNEAWKKLNPDKFSQLESMRRELKTYGLTDDYIDEALEKYRVEGKDVNIMDLLNNKEETKTQENDFYEEENVRDEFAEIDEDISILINDIKANPTAYQGIDIPSYINQLVNEYSEAGYSKAAQTYFLVQAQKNLKSYGL